MTETVILFVPDLDEKEPVANSSRSQNFVESPSNLRRKGRPNRTEVKVFREMVEFQKFKHSRLLYLAHCSTLQPPNNKRL